MMKILFITNIPSPYRVDFFNELGKNCELTVTFEKTTSTERDKSWGIYKFENFKGIFLKGVSLNTDTAICVGLKKIIKKGNFDRIICANISSPTTILAIKYMQRKKIPYIIESDGAFKKNGKGIKERIKKSIISRAQKCFSTNVANDEYFEFYGAKKENIVRYPFTSLFEKDILKAVPTKEEKAALKRELGIVENKVVLSVGQFIKRKGFDLLINSACDLSIDIGFYIVGGTPTEEYLKVVNEKNLTNVHFVGFLDKENLKKYYKAADVFAFPTREDIWGLVVNEAMANGLPIITTDRCGAGLDLVKENENGKIIPINDKDALTDAINEIFTKVLALFSENSLKKIRNYTIENMAEKHLAIFGEK